MVRGGNRATEAPRGELMFAYAYDDKNGSEVFDINGMSDEEIIAYAMSKFPNLTSIEVEVGDNISDIDPVNPETRVIWSR
jgi:hypothetical protein